jgi:hypothetical protein
MGIKEIKRQILCLLDSQGISEQSIDLNSLNERTDYENLSIALTYFEAFIKCQPVELTLDYLELILEAEDSPIDMAVSVCRLNADELYVYRVLKPLSDVFSAINCKMMLEHSTLALSHSNREELRKAFQILSRHQLTRALPFDVICVCIEAVLNDHIEYINTASIISILIRLNALSEIKLTEDYLQKVAQHPIKIALLYALDLLLTRDFPDELARVCVQEILENKNFHIERNPRESTLSRVTVFFAKIAMTPHRLMYENTTVFVNLFHVYDNLLPELGWPSLLNFMDKAFVHPSIEDLNNAINEFYFYTQRTSKTSSQLLKRCLETILKEEKDPLWIADVLTVLFNQRIFISPEMANRIVSYPNKSSLCSMIFNLLSEKKLSSSLAPAYVFGILMTEPDPDELFEMIRIIDDIHQYIQNEIDLLLTPKLNPSSVEKFIEITALLQGIEKAGISLVWNEIKQEITNSIDATYAEINDGFIELIAHKLPFKLKESYKESLFNSPGHFKYFKKSLEQTRALFAFFRPVQTNIYESQLVNGTQNLRITLI